MKIQIDTKEDSHEEIRKVIKMLSSLVGDQEIMSNQSNIFSDNTQNDNQNSDIFSMFSSGSSSNASDSNLDALDSEKKDKKDDDVSIDIEEYL